MTRRKAWATVSGDTSRGAEGDIFYSIENLTGSGYNDFLAGDGGVNVLVGGNGIDTLYGMGGFDTLRGGNDGDFLWGHEGNDTLDGGAGNDTMGGGLNDDTYFVHDAGDIITELAGEGQDTVFAMTNYHLTGLNVEVLSLTAGTATTAVGSSQTNTIYGNDLDNVIDGGGGSDSLSGMGGNDSFQFYAGQAHGDTVYDFQGNGAAAGDRLVFVGYGTAADGASFVHVSGNDWQVNSADGSVHEIITIVGASVDGSDFLFV